MTLDSRQAEKARVGERASLQAKPEPAFGPIDSRILAVAASGRGVAALEQLGADRQERERASPLAAVGLVLRTKAAAAPAEGGAVWRVKSPKALGVQYL